CPNRASQAMNTEKTNGESTPPAITSFSPGGTDAATMDSLQRDTHPARARRSAIYRWPGGRSCLKVLRHRRSPCSSSMLPPSPPAEKATTSKDQARKSRTGNGAGAEVTEVG